MSVSKLTTLEALATFKKLQDAANDEKFVAKVDGKDLSSNDFTDDLKAKLDSLENYTLQPTTRSRLGASRSAKV